MTLLLLLLSLLLLLLNNVISFQINNNRRYYINNKNIMKMNNNPKTLFDKIWESHVVDDSNGNSLIYIDRHLVHEVTSPQAFEGLRTAGRGVRRPDCTCYS